MGMRQRCIRSHCLEEKTFLRRGAGGRSGGCLLLMRRREDVRRAGGSDRNTGTMVTPDTTECSTNSTHLIVPTSCSFVYLSLGTFLRICRSTWRTNLIPTYQLLLSRVAGFSPRPDFDLFAVIITEERPIISMILIHFRWVFRSINNCMTRVDKERILCPGDVNHKE